MKGVGIHAMNLETKPVRTVRLIPGSIEERNVLMDRLSFFDDIYSCYRKTAKQLKSIRNVN